ncbi:MAG: class I SAM-dependent methyltransferase [Myxococcales bacterium]
MDRRLLAKAYDRSAEGYDERFRALQRVKFRAAAPLLEPGPLCVDAGGGTGLLLEWARDERPQLLQGARWLVVDLSLGMLRLARGRTPLVVAADLARLPVREADLVCAFTSVLAEVPRALGELERALRPGGQLVVSFLAAEAPARFPDRLRLEAGPLPAGQDVVFSLRKA